MSLRFRRTIKLAPGVRLNLSKSGLGLSAGVRGATVSIGPRGAYANLGIPGTGLSYRKKLPATRTAVNGPAPNTSRRGPAVPGAPAPSAQLPDPEADTAQRLAAPPVDLILDADGTVHLTDETGVRLSPAVVRRVRARHDAEIRGWLEEWCDERNRLSGRILNLHLETPGPETPLQFDARPFEESVPEPFIPHVPGLRDRSWPPARKKIEEENAAGQQRYEEELWEWRRRKSAHEAAEAQRRKALEIGRYGDRIVMESFLAGRLEGMSWPAETAVAFEISLDATVVFLDVDLPEIEMIPDHEAAVAARGLRIRFDELSDAQLRRAYAWHVHGVLFRLIGEVFVALPGVERVVASGYTQRPDPATGRISDDYLISAEVEREIWARIDFTLLDAIDLPAAFERFQLRRRMTRHGVFTAIEPFGAATAGGLFG